MCIPLWPNIHLLQIKSILENLTVHQIPQCVVIKCLIHVVKTFTNRKIYQNLQGLTKFVCHGQLLVLIKPGEKVGWAELNSQVSVEQSQSQISFISVITMLIKNIKYIQQSISSNCHNLNCTALTELWTVYSGILLMGVRLTSHWTAAAFTGLLFIPGWEWISEWVKKHSNKFLLGQVLILFSYLCMGLQNGLFFSRFPTKISCAFLVSPMRATCLKHFILFFAHPNNIWWSVQVLKLLVMQLSSYQSSDYLKTFQS
jgi:hypothetical protein